VEVTLEQLSRALAAHALLVAQPDAVRGFLAPEIGEAYASFVHRFALGEAISRPNPKPDVD